MADKRKPECRIILEESRRRVSVELFPAGLFPGGEHLDGQYRARVGRRWLRLSGQRYVFWTWPEVLAWLACSAGGGPELPSVPAPVSAAETTPCPDLPKGSRVEAETGRVTPEGMRLTEKTFTMTEPFQGVDGQWRVFLVGRGEPVLVEELAR